MNKEMKYLVYIIIPLLLCSCAISKKVAQEPRRMDRCKVLEPIPLLPTGDGEVFYTPSLYSASIPKNYKKAISEERKGPFWYIQYSHRQVIIIYDDLYGKWKDGDEGIIKKDSVERILEGDLNFCKGPKMKERNHYIKKSDGIVLLFINISDKNVDEYIHKTISDLKVSLKGIVRPTEKDVEEWKKFAHQTKTSIKP